MFCWDSAAENQVAISMTQLKLAYSQSSQWMCNHSDNGWVTYHQEAGLKLGDKNKSSLAEQFWVSPYSNCISKPCDTAEICTNSYILLKTVIIWAVKIFFVYKYEVIGTKIG